MRTGGKDTLNKPPELTGNKVMLLQKYAATHSSGGPQLS